MLSSLPTPSAAARAILRGVRSAEPALLTEFFERAARRWPNNIAIEVPPSSRRPTRRTISYAELDRLSTSLAADLRECVTGECVVAILLPRDSEHIYLAQLAVLKAGAAYTCLDPAFPDGQIGNILDDARPVAVLTDAGGFARVQKNWPKLPSVLDLGAWDQGFIRDLAPADWLTPHSLAYVIYTSGTTGRPKGVMIEHAGIANLIRGDMAELPVKPTDRVGQNSSCSYDSSLEEIWMALAAGATLVVMDDETTRLGPDLIDWLHAEGVTIFSPPPTLLRATGGGDPGKLQGLHRIHVGGEPLPRDVADRWAPGRILLNDYGPTECSVVALRAVIGPDDPITIGRPVPGVRAWVLNERLEEVEVGETGELCLGGVGLARGYLNDPALTARKFPVHPRLGRIYRTGDLAHCDEAGNFYCHGRIDTQVKIRGYRIELEAIESRLVECAGVRAAACRVQGDGPRQQIVAFVVPTEAGPPSADELKRSLRTQLPEYMIPSQFGFLAGLPTTVSGKLNRRALPELAEIEQSSTPEAAGPLTPPDSLEDKVTAAIRRVLSGQESVSVDQDFFHDLGGDSLRAAGLISILRDDPATAALTVRDVYEARTVRGLVQILSERGRDSARTTTGPQSRSPGARHPLLATIVQTIWLLLEFMIAGPVVYLLAVQLAPDLTRGLGLALACLAAPLLYFASLGVYTAAAVAFAVLLKKILIGRYRPLRAPVWGSFHVRNWMVQQAVRLVPWRVLEGTVFQHAVLRALGARIGKRVHIHHGGGLLQGGWDLLDVGDDVTISRDATLQLVDLQDGQIIIGPIAVGSGCTLEVRATLTPHSRMEPESWLSAQSVLPPGAVIPPGERWSGVPACPAGFAPAAPVVPDSRHDLSPGWHGIALLLGRVVLGLSPALPLAILALLFAWVCGIDAETAVEWVLHPAMGAMDFFVTAAILTLIVPANLVSWCLSMRALGRIPPGVISRWSPAYIRLWLKMGILDSASEWLNGALLWRVWLRAAGMKIGRNTELTTIFDTVPELVEMGTGTFLADSIYLAGPQVHRGTVTLATTRLGDGVFLGNYAVIPPGQTIPDGVLLGVCTVAPEQNADGKGGPVVRPGTSWFGQPPFELPKREILECDARLTMRPSRIRYANRVFWELLRFTLPLPPVFLALAWFDLLGQAESIASLPVLLLAVVPALDFGLVGCLCLLALGLKWALLGRVKPGTHPLWSCWVSRWDFNYTAWQHLAQGPVSMLEGTVWMNWYLRALGVKIGRGAILGIDPLAFAVDPDMLTVADGATVSPLFQAHTFEDRVLKIDRVTIGRRATVGNGAVLLYGADIGEGARVVSNSVVMKGERLQPGRTYAGCPVSPQPAG